MKGKHEKIKPTAAADYNINKICVDKSDQMLAY
jgi:hypothetical protein